MFSGYPFNKAEGVHFGNLLKTNTSCVLQTTIRQLSHVAEYIQNDLSYVC